MRRLLETLSADGAPALIVLLGFLVVLPTLGAGLMMDDVLVRMRMLGAETAWGAAAWWDLYTFARPDLNGALRDAGLHPWWADPSVKMVFFRPLSAATHHLDYALWPEHPALHHLHSALWYGAAVASAGAVLRQIHPTARSQSRLAMLLFAVCAPHATTTGWVAARNTLIAFVLSCLMLTLHLRGRHLGALAVLIVGLLSGEAMLGGLAYVAAWQLLMADEPWRRRLGILLPYGGVMVAWRMLYTAAGFGSQATAIYHDPGADPLGFLAAVGTNLPVLLMSRWTLLPLDGWAILSSTAQHALVVLSLIVLPLVAALLWPLLQAERTARFWAAGMVLSLVPFTATMPMDRLVLFGSLGASALIAARAVHPGAAPFVRRVCTGLLVLHLPLSALFGLARGATAASGTAVFSSGMAQAPRDSTVPEQTFVYVTGTFHRVHYTTLMRQTTGDAFPRRSVVLSSMLSGATVTRPDTDTLVVAPSGGFMTADLDRIHRRDARALPVGTRIPLPDLEVEILALTDDGRPAEAAFHFHAPLEDPSLRWLVVSPQTPATFPPQVLTEPFSLPGVGETVTVPAAVPVL